MEQDLKSFMKARGFRAFRSEDTIPLEGLCIPLTHCVCVKPGPLDPEILRTLEKEHFDQAPVYDKDSHRFWGLVETSHLQLLERSGSSLQIDDPQVRTDIEFDPIAVLEI